MSIVEARRIPYMYIPGERGFDLESILDRIAKGQIEGDFVAESGRRLDYTSRKGYLNIEQPGYHLLPERVLNAKLSPVGVASFWVETADWDRKNPSLNQHPDLNAKKFIAAVLGWWEREGLPVNACKGFWSQWSRNFEEFFETYAEERNNKVEAAQNTWSGKIFMSHGFTSLTETDIEIKKLRLLVTNRIRKRVEATFRKS